MFWELLKCMIRGKTISYASYIKKKNTKTENDLELKLAKLLENYEIDPSELLNSEIKILENELVQHREKIVTGIMARAKARWVAEGEKCTNYFCNLEKRNYNEKIIPKLIKDNGEEIFNQSEILEEQKSFYEKLYSSTNPILHQEHKNLFFDENNPFIRKLSDEQRLQAEGNLNTNECLKTLKNMKNSTSMSLL
ncbi:unnamed protein product [Mytilus edulis]|uniref:Uncharacterized protein n=1 Tax=Mytilus edulis TaxID=6550 RepID=A0A8S3PTQ4_MYTED|nr:unnamed protein product [Mytilus edulis]